MKVYAGTSGYAYEEWKGSFYPSDLRPDGFLRHYAGRLPAVEVNNTFYRMPRSNVIAAWVAEVPDGFRFVLKASRRITHQARLSHAEQAMEYLVSAVRGLGEHRGPTLFQLPPDLRLDLERLERFLPLVPDDLPAAFEFRHPSWHTGEVFELLRARGAALVTSDDDGEEEGTIVPTAPFGYLRLRRTDYDDGGIARWADRIRVQPWDEVWVFLKHEDGGEAPRLAQEMLDLLA